MNTADKEALHAAILALPCNPPNLMPHPSDYGSYRMGIVTPAMQPQSLSAHPRHRKKCEC